MATLEAGSLYYTVSIDRASLQRAIKDVRELGNAVDRQSNQAKEGNSVLRKMAQEAGILANRVTQLKADFDSNEISHDKMMEGLRGVQGAARALRGELETTGAASIETAGDASYFQSVLTRLASILKQTSASTAQSEGKLDMLGDSFKRLRNDIDRVGIDMRSLRNIFESGEMSIDQYTREMKELIATNKLLETRLESMTSSLNLSNKQMKAQAQAMGQVTRNTKAGQQAITRATGKFQSMAIAQQLSYGATTLLNDRIFQLSPALGILTNQLIFTTKGMKAFLVSALPIVAVAGAIIGVLGTLVVSLKSGSGLESALADVRKTTGLTASELYRLTESMQELSTEIPTSVSDLLGMARVAGQLGIKGVDNIERFTETIAKLSVATDVAGEEGATSLARFLQATGTEMDQMGSKAEEVANVLNALENNMAATAAEILQMTSYTQGLSSQAGLTQDEILGLNAAILSLGVKAEAGGSAVVRTMSKIQVAASKGGDELATMAEASGMTVSEFQSLAKESPVNALMALTRGLNATAEAGGDLNDLFVELGVNEVRERRTLFALVQGYDTLEDAMYQARKESFLVNSLNEEVEIQANTLEARLQILKNTFVAMAQDIGRRLVPVAKELVNSLIGVAEHLDIVAGALGGIATLFATRGIIGLFTNLTSAIVGSGGLAYGLGRLVGAIQLLLTGPFGLAVLAAALGGTVMWAMRDVKEASEEAGEALDDYTADVEGVIDAFSRVRDKNDMLIALDAVSAKLEGEAKEAWDDYRAGIETNIDEVDNLKEALDEALSKFLALRGMALEPSILQAEGEVTQGLGDVRALYGQLGLPEALWGSLETMNLDQALNAAKALREAHGDLVTPTGQRPLRGLISDLEALIELRERQAEIEAAIASGRSALGEGENGNGDGGGEAGGDKNPVKDIMDRLNAEVAVLEYRFFELGEISAEEYFNGLKSAQTQARDALMPIMLVPGEFADAARESFGVVETYLEDTLSGLRNSAHASVEEVRAARDALARLYPGYGTPREVGGAEGAARDRANQARIDQARARSRAMIADDQRELDNELSRLRAEQAEEEREWLDRKVSMHERTSGIVRNIVEMDQNALTRSIEAEREAQERNDLFWESRADRMRRRNAERIRESQRILDLRIRELELLEEQEARERAIANARQAGAAVDRLFPGAVGEEDAKEKLEDARAIGEANREYEESMADITAMLESGYIDAHEAASMKTEALRRRIEAIAEVTGYATPFIAQLVAKLKELEDAEPRKLTEPEVMASASESTLQGVSRILGEIADTVPGLAGQVSDALSSVAQGTDEIITGFAMMADGSKGGTETIVKGVNSIANGLLAILPVQDSVANQMIEGFFGAAGAAAELATGIPGLGQAISAVGSVFSRILGDMSNGLKQIAEQVDEFAASSSYLNESLVQAFADMATETVSRGGILGWLGFTRRQLNEELFDLLTSVATGLANGIAGAINQGIMDGLSGEDWQENLKDNLRKSIVESVIQAFVETAIMKGVFNDFFLRVTELIAEGEIGKAMDYAERVFPELLSTAEGVIEDFLDVIPPEFREAYEQDGADGDTKAGSGGTRISEITGPTRDLLIDLFRPLAVMPSWTSMIRDIRNDVRRLAQSSYPNISPNPVLLSGRRNDWMYSRAGGGGGISIDTMYVQTTAGNTRELVRDISKYTFKERRGGK